VINAFTYGMTCEVFVHVLIREALCMMQELLDVATKNAKGEEAIQANFNGKAKAAGHLSGGDGGDESTSAQRHRGKRARDRKHRGEEMVAATDHVARP
jgi:hypothetical protein